jgi:hypothetical protein
MCKRERERERERERSLVAASTSVCARPCHCFRLWPSRVPVQYVAAGESGHTSPAAHRSPGQSVGVAIMALRPRARRRRHWPPHGAREDPTLASGRASCALVWRAGRAESSSLYMRVRAMRCVATARWPVIQQSGTEREGLAGRRLASNATHAPESCYIL